MTKIPTSQNNRIIYLDFLRVLACLMVIFIHSIMPAESSDGIYVSFMTLIASPSSELFLALSGAIILPIKTDSSSFYKKRFTKLLPPPNNLVHYIYFYHFYERYYRFKYSN